MITPYNLETARKVLDGYLSYSTNESQTRTPLHVPFPDKLLSYAKSQQITDFEQEGESNVHNPTLFNAVGSKVLWKDTHKPVVDADGGARVQTVRRGSKVIIISGYLGTYRPDSTLRDVFGDNNIDSEVFTYPVLEHSKFTGQTNLIGQKSTALVLRSKESDMFETFDSTTENHSHLYIQQEFSSSDHSELIKELGSIGIISPQWQELVEQEGMGVVRTPWTEKKVSQKSS